MLLDIYNAYNAPLQGQLQSMYNQIIHSIPKSRRDAILSHSENIRNLIFEGHHLIKNHQIYYLNKMSSKEVYSILIDSSDSKPSSQLYYKMFFKIRILIGKLFLCYLV